MGPKPVVSPGDPTGATGPTRVVAAVNVRVGVYDRTGSTLLAPLRLRSMSHQLAGLSETDPKVVYDAYDDVFVLTFLAYDSSEGYIEVVTIPSATAEDPGTWCRTHMVGDQVRNGTHEFADYPSVGFTANRVVVTTNNFGFNDGPFRYAQVISMPKGALYDDPSCTKTVPIEVLGESKTKNPDGSKAFTLQAAQSVGGAPTDQFLVSLEPKASSARLVLWRLRMVSGTAQDRQDRRARAARGAAAVWLPVRQHDQREHVVGHRRPPADVGLLRRRDEPSVCGHRRRRQRRRRAAGVRDPLVRGRAQAPAGAFAGAPRGHRRRRRTTTPRGPPLRRTTPARCSSATRAAGRASASASGPRPCRPARAPRPRPR